MRSLAPDYVAAFAAGGPVGFSCDLTALSDAHMDFFRRMVAERKRDEAFWREAVGRVLCDTPEVVALQYSDAAWMERGVDVETGLFTAAELRFGACRRAI